MINMPIQGPKLYRKLRENEKQCNAFNVQHFDKALKIK